MTTSTATTSAGCKLRRFPPLRLGGSARKIVGVTSLAISLTIPPALRAQTSITWSGGDSTDWAAAGNWVGGIAPTSDLSTNIADFSSAFTNQPNAGMTSIAGLTFGSSSAVTLSGTSLTLGGSGIVKTGSSSDTISSALVLGALQTWSNDSSGLLTISNTINNGGFGLTIGGSGNTTISGVIGGTGGLTKTGSGTLTLSTATNTFSGGLTISGGMVAVDNNLRLGGTNGTAGAVTLDGGTLRMNLGTTAQTNSHVINVGASGGTIVINSTSGTPTYKLGDSNNLLTGSGNLTISGTGTLVQAASAGASVFVMSKDNSGYSGNVTITNGGVVEFANATAIPTSSTFTVDNLGMLSANGVTIAQAVNVNDGGYLAFQNNGNGVFSGPITLTGNTTVRMQNWWNGAVQNGRISGDISGTGSLTVNSGSGSGATLTLTGNNTYSGNTTITASTLAATKTAALSGYTTSGKISVGSTGTLAVNAGGTGEFSTSDLDTLRTNVSFTAGGLLGIDTTNAGGSLTYGSNIGGVLGLKKLGTGTLTLSGANTYTGQTTVSAGTLNYFGTLSSAAHINVGVGGGGNAVMNIQTGSSITMSGSNNILVGNGVNGAGQGFIYQTGGSIAQGTYNQLQLGAANGTSYGYYNMSGGTASISEVDIGGFSGASTGVLDMSGGTMTVGVGSTNGWLIVNRTGGSGGTGILNLTGGALTFTGPATQFQNNWGTNGTAIINISNATLTATNANINLNQRNDASNFGEINLLAGGTLQANSIASNANGTKLVNFNGGTLKASNATTTFITTNNTAVNVYGNGGTIDNNGVNITIPVGLLAASGSGVSSVAISNGGSGYLGAPAVKFSGGGGTGAAGYAIVSGGVITGIVITNPGTGYTSAPTITLTGGGGSGAAIGTISTAANTSGGMTFSGSGKTTLSAASTYTGLTTISAGTLALGASGSIDDSSGVNLGTAGSQGTLDLTAKSSFTFGSGQTLSGYGTVNIGTGKTVTIDGILAPGNSPGIVSVTGSLTLAGTSTTNMEIAGTGTAGTAYDLISVSETLNYGGLLAVTFLDSFTPSAGDSFKLFDFTTQSGAFSSVTITGMALDADGIGFSGTVGGLAYTFTNADGVLSVASAIPEPSTYAAIAGAFALAGVVWQRRRRAA